jgi:putative N6-adenine-specific DNA methylase
MDFNISSRIIVACPNRIAPYLAEEIRALGYFEKNILKTGVELEGTMLDCIRLNLNLRCATQVRFSLHAFRARQPEDIYETVKKISWENIIPKDGYFSVNNSAEHLTLNNTMFINVKVKDAIVDRFRGITGARPDSGSETDHTVIHLHWKDDRAEIFLDTSGPVISKHGYRRIPGKAPMQESLAAALLIASKWDRKSPLVNPMCGSGTIAIEAALLASGRRPGLLRKDYAFQHVVGYNPEFEKPFRSELEKEIVHHLNFPIIASDYRSGAVEDAKENARFAGVEDLIQFQCCDFRESVLPDAPGAIILNPEYGERLGEQSELEQTYQEIGDFFKKKCSGYKGYIFTGNLDLAKKIGLKASRRIEFYSAQIDCRLLEYELYAGSRRIVNPEPQP